MKVSLLHFLLLLFLLSACPSAGDKTNETTQTSTGQVANDKTIPAYFGAVLQAHGGKNNWDKLGSMQYQVTRDGKTETQLVDLKNRKVLIKATAYSMGQNGNSVWVSPNKAAFPGKSARFYHNLYFYFFAMPFVLADPGGSYEQLPDLVLEGKSYRVMSVTFGEGIGDSPDDQYRLLINPETKQMEWLLYTVTFFGQKPGEQKFNALKYDGYKEQLGLLFPKQLVGYTYENGQVGAVRYRVAFNNLELKESHPNQQLFERPEKSEIDSSAVKAY